MRKLIVLFAVLTLAVAGTAFAQDDMAETSLLRVAYFAPDAPAVDLYVDFAEGAPEGVDIPGYVDGLGIPLGTLEYTNVTDYIEAPAGSYITTVTAAGDTEPAIDPIPVDLMGGEVWTIAIYGSIENGTLTTAISDDAAIYAEVAEGGSVVSVLNTIEDAPAVNLATPDGVTLVEGLGYIGAPMMDEAMMEEDMDEMATEEAMMDEDMEEMDSGITMIEVPSVYVPADFTGAAYTVQVQSSEDGSVLAEVPDVALEADTAYTVFVYLLDGELGFELVPYELAMAMME